MKSLCLILGLDGCDRCVAANLTKLYQSLGFSVAISGRWLPANMYVLMRGKVTDVSGIRMHAPVHVWSYVGNSQIENLMALQSVTNKVSLFAPSEEMLADADGLSIKKYQIAPPVAVNLWRCKPRYPQYKVVHIGNCKDKMAKSEDKYTRRLTQLAISGDLDIWGQWWPSQIKTHGKLWLENLSYVYSQSQYAIGLMYPFQRDAGTYSSRFFQAPLAGAILLSEPNRYCGQIPGVVANTIEKVKYPDRSMEDRNILVEKSTEYWHKRYLDARTIINHCLSVDSPVPGSTVSTQLNRHVWNSRVRLLVRQPMVLYQRLRGC